jgi:hypothetical protein
MAEVKIEEKIYKILESHFTDNIPLSENDILECKKFFSEKRYKRFLRETRPEDYYRNQRLKKMIPD